MATTTKTPAGKALRGKVYEKLLRLIASGEISPSEILSQRKLARRFGVSTQPVGAALRRLEIEGVVESIPRVGTRVRQVNAEDMWGMLQWRAALEARAAALAAEWADAESKQNLVELADRMDADIKGQDRARGLHDLWREDMAFHGSVAEASCCSKLITEMGRLNIYYLKVKLCEVVSATRSPHLEGLVSHRTVADAIMAGDVLASERLMREHVEGSSLVRDFVAWYRGKRKAGR